MPTYEFRAPDGSIHERTFRMSEVPQSITLADGSVAERMISSGAGLVFKGSGFYITDYGKDGKKDVRDATSKAKAAETKAAESKAEGKSAESKSESSPKADAPAAKSDSAPAKTESKPAAPSSPKKD